MYKSARPVKEKFAILTLSLAVISRGRDEYCILLLQQIVVIYFQKKLKVAAADMTYFARTKFSRILVHKKNFSWI